MSQSEDIHRRIAKVLGQVFDELPDEIGPKTSAVDIPAWDSLNHINVILALEREFKIRFTSAQAQDVENVGEIADIIAEKLARS